jgi:hypothetical protein
MAFLAALPEVIGPMLARVGASVGARAAAGAAEGGAGEAGGGMASKITKMPMPNLGSNGGRKGPSTDEQLDQTDSVLNGDQFRA